MATRRPWALLALPLLLGLPWSVRAAPEAGFDPAVAPGALATALGAFAASTQEVALPCHELALSPRLDLPALVASALCNRQLGAIQRAELALHEAQVNEARAGYFPTGQLSIGGSGTKRRYSGEFGYSERQSAGTAAAAISWRAWDFGARALRVQAARLDTAASAATAAQASLDLAQRVLQLHREVLARTLFLRSREADTALLTRIVTAQETLAARTLPAGADAHAARLRLAQHLAQLDADRAQLARARVLLAAAAGVPPERIETTATAPGAPASTPAVPDIWIERAVEHHPAVRAALSARQAAQARADEARRARYPVVDLTAARYANRSGSSAITNGRAITDEVGIQMNWTFFDGGTTNSRIDMAAANARKLTHQWRDVQDEVTGAIRSDLAELQGLAAAWAAAQQRQEAARAALDSTRRRLAAGQATRPDEWEAELLLSLASRDVDQIGLQAWEARNRLALDAGALELLIPVTQEAAR